MSGITAQSVMRRKYGIIICHIKTGKGYFSQVFHQGKLIFESPDDCLASGSVILTNKIWSMLPQTTLSYDMQPAYAYLQGKNVMAAMKDFDQSEFERNLLPRLRREEALKHQLAVYDENCGQANESETYFLYDVLVRLFCYARNHNIKLQREGIEGMEITDAVTALRDHSAVCIHVTGSPFWEALKLIHTDSVEIVIGGESYLLKDVPIETYSCVKGGTHLEPPPELVTDMLSGQITPLAEVCLPELGHVDEDDRQQLCGLVARILGQGGVGATQEEKDLIGFSKNVCGTGKTIGKNALMGLGAIVKEGPLAERLDALYQELVRKVRGLLGPSDTYKLAASRLASMNSAKVLKHTGGGLVIMDRITPGLVVGEGNCLA